MLINGQNPVIMHLLTEEIVSYFENGWIRMSRSYAFIDLMQELSNYTTLGEIQKSDGLLDPEKYTQQVLKLTA